jgi:hypothetical protein
MILRRTIECLPIVGDSTLLSDPRSYGMAAPHRAAGGRKTAGPPAVAGGECLNASQGGVLNALSCIKLPAALCFPRQVIALRRSSRAPPGRPMATYGNLRRTYGGS